MSTRHQISQLVTLNQAAQCSGVDLCFDALTGDVRVELRATVSGQPADAVLAQALIPAAGAIGRVTRRAQWQPALLEGNADYAIVIECANPSTSICIAQVGAHDTVADRWMTALPFSIGALAWRSDDEATWTPRPDTCLAFTLLAPQYTAAQQTLALGSVAVTDAADLMLASEAIIPELGAACTYTLTLDDARAFEVDAGQVVNLPASYSGSVAVAARLRRGQRLAPVVQPGATLVAGSVASDGDYIGPVFSAVAASELRATFKALLPAGSAVHVDYQADESGTWLPLPYHGSASQAAGVLEITHQGALAGASQVRLRLRLSGAPTARPLVTDLFAVTL